MDRLWVSVNVIEDGTEVDDVGEPLQVNGLPCPDESAAGLAVSSSGQYPTSVGSVPFVTCC